MGLSQKPYSRNTSSESALIIVSGSEFQTVGAEQRKARLAKSVLVNGLSSSGMADERSVRSLTPALMIVTTEVCRCCGVAATLEGQQPIY